MLCFTVPLCVLPLAPVRIRVGLPHQGFSISHIYLDRTIQRRVEAPLAILFQPSGRLVHIVVAILCLVPLGTVHVSRYRMRGTVFGSNTCGPGKEVLKHVDEISLIESRVPLNWWHSCLRTGKPALKGGTKSISETGKICLLNNNLFNKALSWSKQNGTAASSQPMRWVYEIFYRHGEYDFALRR